MLAAAAQRLSGWGHRRKHLAHMPAFSDESQGSNVVVCPMGVPGSSFAQERVDGR
jgi:hypothetical protein